MQLPEAAPQMDDHFRDDRVVQMDHFGVAVLVNHLVPAWFYDDDLYAEIAKLPQNVVPGLRAIQWPRRQPHAAWRGASQKARLVKGMPAGKDAGSYSTNVAQVSSC